VEPGGVKLILLKHFLPNLLGGLGESVSRVLALHHPAPQEFVAVNDSFGESGTPEQLMEKYKLNNQAIVAAAEKVIKRK
jgi:transketolase